MMLYAALNMPANLESSAVATRLENVSFHFNPKERQCQRMFKLLHNCTHLTCCKVMLKFSKPGFKSTWTENLQTFKLGLKKSEEPEIKLRTSVGPQKKQASSRKHLLLLYWLRQNLWLCGSQQTVENSSRDGNTRPPYLPPEKSVCRSKRTS